MRRLLLPMLLLTAALAVVRAQEKDGTGGVLDPYQRIRNGPPLTRVFQKARTAWLLAKLQDPTFHPAARMPDFQFTEEEALDILAYLKSVAGPAPAPPVAWPSWAGKTFDDMNDEEADAMFEVLDRGKALWRQARCSICHTTNGRGGTLVGGFVDLRVGGIDLQLAGDKLQRDWLYAWIREPKDHFPETLMPRFAFTPDEIKALSEYILREEDFRAPSDEDEEKEEPPARDWRVLDDPERAVSGKRLVELSRCVVCHEVAGMQELLSREPRRPPPPAGTFEFLAYDRRCFSCHGLNGRAGTYAPDLTTAGSRLRADWIEQFVAAPDMIRPLSQQMPKLNLSPEEAKVAAEFISKNLKDPRIPEAIPGGPTTAEQRERGRAAFRGLGCVSCHTAEKGEPGGVVGPDLTAVGDRLRPGYIWYHLKHPHAANPHSPEPDYGLSDEQAVDLAAYLAAKRKP